MLAFVIKLRFMRQLNELLIDKSQARFSRIWRYPPILSPRTQSGIWYSHERGHSRPTEFWEFGDEEGLTTNYCFNISIDITYILMIQMSLVRIGIDFFYIWHKIGIVHDIIPTYQHIRGSYGKIYRC